MQKAKKVETKRLTQPITTPSNPKILQPLNPRSLHCFHHPATQTEGPAPPTHPHTPTHQQTRITKTTPTLPSLSLPIAFLIPTTSQTPPKNQVKGDQKRENPKNPTSTSSLLFLDGKMMNRPSSSPSSDPYYHLPPPSIMPFVGLDNSWDTHPIPTSDPPFGLPMPTLSFPFCPPMPSAAIDHYPSPNCFVKTEENTNYTTAAIGPGSSSNSRIGLNLGHRTYFSGDALAINRLLTARALHHHRPPRCQVEGCKADLLGAKHYHRRHKVCEFHSKATIVIAGGLHQRFCQQCSRFHVLAEFDESKRSCRKRLADHNRRRRKSQNNNSADRTKNNASRDSSSKSTSTATTTTNSGGGLEGSQGEQTKAVLFRREPALSLGAQQGMYNYRPSTSTNNNNNNNGGFYHQSLFGSSSNEASQSTGGGSDQNQTNLLHLGQAMFEVDFM